MGILPASGHQKVLNVQDLARLPGGEAARTKGGSEHKADGSTGRPNKGGKGDSKAAASGAERIEGTRTGTTPTAKRLCLDQRPHLEHQRRSTAAAPTAEGTPPQPHRATNNPTASVPRVGPCSSTTDAQRHPTVGTSGGARHAGRRHPRRGYRHAGSAPANTQHSPTQPTMMATRTGTTPACGKGRDARGGGERRYRGARARWDWRGADTRRHVGGSRSDRGGRSHRSRRTLGLRAADAQADSAINAHADTCLVKSQYDG